MKIIIIGAGPGGYTAAFEAATRGWDVTVIENRQIGGTCLNRGCIPTKSMRACADALEMSKRLSDYAVTGCGQTSIDMSAMQKRKDKIISVLAGGLEKSFAKLKIDYVQGQAQILGTGKVKVGQEIYKGDAIIIAAGSSILELPSLAFDHTHVLSSDDALNLSEVPQKLLIVGGGVIGCELACIYRSFGSQVTVVEGLDRLLPIPSIDADISNLLGREMKKRKIKVILGATVSSYKIENNEVIAEIAPSPFVDSSKSSLKEPASIAVDKMFVTIGRKADTEGLGLSAAGIATDKRGWIQVNEAFQTNLQGVYAIGDILGPAYVMLAHAASMEGVYCIAAIAGENRPMDHRLIPSAIFTEPEIGSVGLSEQQALANNQKVATGVFQIRELGKAQAMGELPGFFKIVADCQTGKMLGVHIMGSRASDLVAEGTLALARNLTVQDLANVVHAHPTLAEGLYEAAKICAANMKK